MSFEEVLVPAITGYKIEEIQEENKAAITVYCVSFS